MSAAGVLPPLLEFLLVWGCFLLPLWGLVRFVDWFTGYRPCRLFDRLFGAWL